MHCLIRRISTVLWHNQIRFQSACPYSEYLGVAIRKYPNRKAITSFVPAAKTLTYSQLACSSHSLGKSFGSANRIGLFLPFESADFAISVHASAMNHRCFLPLDPTHPPELLRYFLSDFNADMVVFNKDTVHLLPSLSNKDEKVKYRCLCVGETNEVNAICDNALFHQQRQIQIIVFGLKNHKWPRKFLCKCPSKNFIAGNKDQIRVFTAIVVKIITKNT